MVSKKLFHKNSFLAKLKVYSSILALAKGLMFSSPLKKGEGIVLASKKENLSSIHMLFVFFPIDAVWMDKNKKISFIKRNIKPFTPLVTPPKFSQFIVELPANSTKKLKVNDKLVLK